MQKAQINYEYEAPNCWTKPRIFF